MEARLNRGTVYLQLILSLAVIFANVQEQTMLECGDVYCPLERLVLRREKRLIVSLFSSFINQLKIL